MALGRPIITTNVAGCRETVEVACEALEQNLMVLRRVLRRTLLSLLLTPISRLPLQKAVWW